MPGNIWQNPLVQAVNTNTNLKFEVFTATAAQTDFTLTLFNYVVGTESLAVFRNGSLVAPGVELAEIDTQTFRIAASTAGDQIVAVGFVGVTAVVGSLPAASQAEAAGLTLNTVATTPFNFINSFNSILGGYQKNGTVGFAGVLDLDTININSAYSFDSAQVTNEPPDLSTLGHWGYIITYVHYNDPNYAKQICYGLSGTASRDRQWVRTKDAGVWGAWTEQLSGTYIAGLQSTGQTLLTALDLDTLLLNGQYIINTNANSPLGAGLSGTLEVLAGTTSASCIQRVVGISSGVTGKIWIRERNGSVWGSWVEITAIPAGTVHLVEPPELLYNHSSIVDTWVTTSSTTLSNNSAKAAILQVSTSFSVSGTVSNAWTKFRKPGSGLQPTDARIVAVTAINNLNTAAALPVYTTGEVTVVLDSSYNFDWITQPTPGAVGGTTMSLRGYII